MSCQPPAPVALALQKLRAAGFRALPVGGCVRDLLLGRRPHDWDLATDAFPEELCAVFSQERTVATGLRHGTLTVLFDHCPVEITSFRADGDYSDARRPDAVRFTRSLEEDLARRDFTVNALCLGEDGRIIDRHGGQRDLQNRVLRCIGDPDRRFGEDALRILRALRLSAALGFTIEAETAAALLRHLDRLSLLAAERIAAEWQGLLLAPGAGAALLQFPAVATALFPDLAPCIGCPQPPAYHCYDVYEHAVRAMDAAPPDFPLRLALLFHDVAKPATADGQGHFYGHDRVGEGMAASLLAPFGFGKGTVSAVSRLIRLHHLPLSPRRDRLRRLLARYGEPTLRQLLAMQRADCQAQNPARLAARLSALDAFEAALDCLLLEKPALSLAALAVNGSDLLEAGVAPGPPIGRTLRALLEGVVAERIPNEKAALLAAARKENGL